MKKLERLKNTFKAYASAITSKERDLAYLDVNALAVMLIAAIGIGAYRSYMYIQNLLYMQKRSEYKYIRKQLERRIASTTTFDNVLTDKALKDNIIAVLEKDSIEVFLKAAYASCASCDDCKFIIPDYKEYEYELNRTRRCNAGYTLLNITASGGNTYYHYGWISISGEVRQRWHAPPPLCENVNSDGKCPRFKKSLSSYALDILRV